MFILGSVIVNLQVQPFTLSSKKHTNAMAYQLVQKVGNGSRNVDSVLLVSVIAVFEEYEQ